jgi:hypothetical protein
MSDKRQALYEVASGKIENPSIEIKVEGEVQRFEGRDAKCFAFGMLAGLKAASDEYSVDAKFNT